MRRLMMIGPMQDRYLTHLPRLLQHLMPQGQVQGCEPHLIPDMILDHIFGDIAPLIDGGSDGDTRSVVELLPNGISVKTVRRIHKVIPEGDAHLLDGRDFPVHGHPFHSILSLLYALAQQDKAEPEVIDSVVDEVSDDVGSVVVEKIKAFLDEVKKGAITIKSDDGRVIHIEVEPEHNEIDEDDVKEAVEKVASLSSPMFVTDDHTRKAIEAAYNKRLLNVEEMRKVGMTQTNILALLTTVDQLRDAGLLNGKAVESLIEALHTIAAHNMVTVSDAETQGKLLSILTHLLNGEEEERELDAHDLIFNTKRPVTQETIVHIEGYPIDVTKLKTMTRVEANKQFTPSLANYIFDEKKGKITLSKIEELLRMLEVIKADKPDMADYLVSRLIDPLFTYLAPDEDLGVELEGE